MEIRINSRDGGLPKRPKMYIASLKLARFAASGVKISVNLPGGILAQGPKIVISRGSFVTLLFDSFGIEVNSRMNPRDGSFASTPKLYISSLKLASFARSGVTIRVNLRGGTQVPKSSFSVSHVALSYSSLFDLEWKLE